jgi:colicin import membrane protein
MDRSSTFQQEVALLPQSSERLGPGAMMAIAAHLLLVAALAYGVHWSASEPESVSAELWASVPQIAAPKAVETPPPPEPVAKPQPQPPVVKEPPPQQRDADIAIEKARKDKAQREAAEQERAEREKARKEKVQREKQEREQAERERAEKDKLAKAKAADEADKKHKADEAKLAQLRADNLKRIQGLAGATGAEDAAGKDQRSAGPSASYGGKIVAAILPNVVSINTFDGNPEALVGVRAAPDGTILGRRILKSSGDKDWDDEVLRAIDRTGRLPRPDTGPVPPDLELRMRPKPRQAAS